MISEIGTSRVVDHFDGATVQLGRPAYDGQAKTGAADSVPGPVSAFDKAPEDVQTVGRRNLGSRNSPALVTMVPLVFVLVGVDQHGGAVGRMFPARWR